MKCNMCFSLVCSQTQQLIVGNTLVSGPTCKCAHVKQVPSVFPCTSPTLCHCDLRILTLNDDIAASDWIHWACAVTMRVIIKAKSKETRFCRAAYSQFWCSFTVRADGHIVPSDTVPKKPTHDSLKEVQMAAKLFCWLWKITSQQMFLETDV